MQEVSEYYKDKGVKIIGLVLPDDKEAAQRVLKGENATYMNITYTDSMYSYMSKIRYTPTTMFINGNGETAREFIVGGQSVNELKKYIDDLLNK